MPKFDPSGDIASGAKTPGRWLVEIPEQYTMKDGTVRAGVETIDHRTGQPRTSKNGDEMWSATAVVVDTHPDAPLGSYVMGLNLLFGGKGRDATYRLLEVLGHPVREWRRITDPSKIPDITPDMFVGRRFVLDTALDDKGYLQPNGFCPYLPAGSQRGPSSGAATSRKSSGNGAHGAGAGPGTQTSAPRAHGAPTEATLPF